MVDAELKKINERLIKNIIDHFFTTTLPNITWTAEPNKQWWERSHCPLKAGKGHFINSQLVYGLGKLEWKCELCGDFEFIDLME